ncbi:MAG: glycosyltransferase family 2 protein [Caulobacteraceae bacterium]
MTPDFSIVVPVFDEEGNAASLAREIAVAFSGRSYEMIFVDDASRDGTLAELTAAKAELPALRVLSHAKNAGQSRAIQTGVLAARAPVVVTLDGDGQNDPADAPALAERMARAPATTGMVQGCRTGRQDNWSKKAASRIANPIRAWILNDGARDAGCGLKAIRRELFLRFPYFDHMHRYWPALTHRDGLEVEFMDVSHRPRGAGVSKYNNLRRLWASLGDMIGVVWLLKRARLPGDVREG